MQKIKANNYYLKHRNIKILIITTKISIYIWALKIIHYFAQKFCNEKFISTKNGHI